MDVIVFEPDLEAVWDGVVVVLAVLEGVLEAVFVFEAVFEPDFV